MKFSTILRPTQVPIEVPDETFGVPEPYYRCSHAFEESFDPSGVNQRHVEVIDIPPWVANDVSTPK